MPQPVTCKTGTTLDRPIFVVGTGRSGSTIFHRIFSEHPDLAWLSAFCVRFPDHPVLNRQLMRAIDWPVIGRFLRRHFKPGECYLFWEHICRGFAEPCRDLLRSDVTPLNRRKIPPALARLVTAGRKRLLVKITGWPRVGFLRGLFPDAKFIHIQRDGRAVVNSLLTVPFWHGWGGPARWGLGELDPAQRAEWERHGKSFVALGGIQWKLLMAAMDDAAKRIPPSDFLQIRYEDFVEKPVACFRDVTRFCGLDWSTRFEQAIAGRRLNTANDKWKADLTPAQQAILETVLAESLERHGYSTGVDLRLQRAIGVARM